MKTYLIYTLTSGAPVSVTLMFLIGISSLYGIFSDYYSRKLILHPFGIFNKKEYYRLFTSDLIHNDAGHLLMNEAMFYLICVNLEQTLNKQWDLGSWYFAVIYFTGYFSGVLIITYRYRNDFNYTSAGASGSIMGCMMSFMILKPHYTAMYLPVFGEIENSIAAVLFILVLIVYQYKTKNSMMNNELHFYCALGGILITLAIFPCVINLTGLLPR